MYKYLICITVLQLGLSCNRQVPIEMGLIPQPSFIVYEKGSFEINDQTVIVIDESTDLKQIADELSSFIQTNFQLNLKRTSKNQANSIQLVKTDGEGKKGAYNLVVAKDGVMIEGKSYQGIFYGFQSLKQMLSPKRSISFPLVNFVRIKDAPQFEWRGMMLDVSRHFFPKDSVKKVIDILAMHKMNKLHFHLTDGVGWRIQIDAYPELTKRGAWRKVPKKGKKPWEDYTSCYEDSEEEVYGGYYTKEDIKELVQYASSRYIDIIPEIEMPGHSEAALQCYPEYTCKGAESSGVYCAGNEDTFKFLENILGEVIDLFPYEYVHIGGDEVNKQNWLQCSDCKKRMKKEKLHDGEELQSYFVKRIEKFIHSKNKKLIAWDEILEGGLPERAAVMSWRGMDYGIKAANEGHNVVMSPGYPLYFDHYQGKSELEPSAWGGYNNLLKVYDFDPLPAGVDEDKRQYVLGAQANLWTEQIPSLEHVQYMIFPRLCALSEALWTSPDKKDRNYFVEKMDFYFDRLSELGYNYAGSSMSPEYEVTYNKTSKNFDLELRNELGAYEIRYTLDGSKPNPNSTLYTKEISYSSAIHLNAQCFRNDIPVGFPLIKQFSTGFGDRCKIKYENDYYVGYSGGGDRALFNNKFGTNRGDDINWQGVQQKDFNVSIDLGEPMKLSYVALNYFQHIGATSVMLPTEVTFSVSKDGITYETILQEQIPTTQNRDPIIKRIEVEFEKRELTYIKIDSKNRGALPEWHIREGDAWIFVDEVSIK